MQNVFKFDFKGLQEIEKKLLDLEASVGKDLLKKAMKDALKPMLAAAKEEVPVVTGQLKANLKIRTLPRSRVSFGFAVQSGDKDHVGKVHYAAKVEFGTSKQPPQGNLRRAFDRTKDESYRIAVDVLKQGLAI